MRASVAFELKDGTEAGDMIIENERLKTTLGLLNSKLKMQTDSEEIIDNLKRKNREYDDENSSLKSEIAQVKSENSSLSS